MARILVVDDYPDTAELIARTLRWVGHEVAAVGSAEEALELCELHHFDLLISDIRMPGKSGWDLVRELQTRQKLPAIAVSGVPNQTVRDESASAGFTEFLSKPVGIDNLREAVERVLKNKGPLETTVDLAMLNELRKNGPAPDKPSAPPPAPPPS